MAKNSGFHCHGCLKGHFAFRPNPIRAKRYRLHGQPEYFSLKALRRSSFLRTFALCKLLRSEPLRRWRRKRLSGKCSDEEDLRRSGRDLLPPRSFIERISILSATVAFLSKHYQKWFQNSRLGSRVPLKRDYISNLKKIKVCIKRQADRESAVPPRRDEQYIFRRPATQSRRRREPKTGF